MPKTWFPSEDGWQTRTVSGVREFRMLKSDTGTSPSFNGSPKRYAYVYELSDGDVIGKSHNGYSRRFDSVSDAKAYLASLK